MNPMEILQDIKNKINKREIFKYNRDELVACLITAVNDLTRSSSLLMRSDMADAVIEQFRAILKFIFENSSNENEITPDAEGLTYKFHDLVMEFMEDYTPVRNYLEQCATGTRELLYDEKMDVYYESKFDKFANYSRIRDRVKTYDSEETKHLATTSMMNYLFRNPKSFIFKDRFYKGLMNDFIDACWLDSEIKFEYEFVDFKYSELISFCAALLLIGEFFFLNQVKYFYGYIKEDAMIDGIRRLTDLSEEKVKLFLNYATYDYEYQKDKLTLIQSLIKGKEGYYFLSYNLTLGNLPIKMCRVMFDVDHKKYERDISAIAKLKEKQMTDEIINAIKKYDVDIKLNYQYRNKETNKIDAEYDILIYDNISNNLYVAECKWFYVGDDEFEHMKLDKKIEKSISYRLDKDKCITRDPKGFVHEVFNKSTVNEVNEILISQNFMGMKKHNMPVLDFETLKLSIGRNDTFKDAMEYVYDEKYIDTIDFEGELHEIEIEGYKFKIYRMVGKWPS